MKVLVTGASGLLGSSVARALIQAGHQVTTLQRRASGIQGVRDVMGSVTDQTAVTTAMAGQNAVIHLAAKVSMAGDASEFERVNVEGTRTVLAAARHTGVTRFVHISSPSVANSGSSLVGAPAEPANPDTARGEYARTKAQGERLVLAASSQDFPVLVLRPHLMWGPGDAQLTERIIERCRQGRMPILGSGGALVDTLYIANAVDAIVAALEAVTRVHGESLVVTNGQPRPIGEFIERLAQAGGAGKPKLRIPAAPALVAGSVVDKIWNLSEHDDEPPLTRFLAEQMTTAHWFDQRRTREILQWEPAVSFDQGMNALTRHYGASDHDRPSVLFVCSKNGGKSQVAAGFMRKEAGSTIEVLSAGTKPGPCVNPLAAEVLLEQGIDIRGEHPRQLAEEDLRHATLVVVLGTEAKVPELEGIKVEVWDTDEPSTRGIEGKERMELLTADIHQRVVELKDRLTRTARRPE